MREINITSTFNGGTIEVEPSGPLFLLHTRDAAGRVVHTVEMSEDDARALLGDLDSEIDYECEGCGEAGAEIAALSEQIEKLEARIERRRRAKP